MLNEKEKKVTCILYLVIFDRSIDRERERERKRKRAKFKMPIQFHAREAVTTLYFLPLHPILELKEILEISYPIKSKLAVGMDSF